MKPPLAILLEERFFIPVSNELKTWLGNLADFSALDILFRSKQNA